MSGLAHAGRKRILERIRAATAAMAPTPGHEGGQGDVSAGIFAPIEDAMSRFEQECAANLTEVHRVGADEEAECLGALLGPGHGTIFVQDAPELRRMAGLLPAAVQRRLRWSSEGPARDADAVGVTLAEKLVARTGSVLISTACGGRLGSVLPPLHVVYAREEQVVAELDQALYGLPGGRQTSGYCLITGPSRTSDIEKKLVIGAHGPTRIVVMLRGD